MGLTTKGCYKDFKTTYGQDSESRCVGSPTRWSIYPTKLTLQLACSGPFIPNPPPRSLSTGDSSLSLSSTSAIAGVAVAGYSHPSCSVFCGEFQKEVKPRSLHLARRSASPWEPKKVSGLRTSTKRKALIGSDTIDHE